MRSWYSKTVVSFIHYILIAFEKINFTFFFLIYDSNFMDVYVVRWNSLAEEECADLNFIIIYNIFINFCHIIL